MDCLLDSNEHGKGEHFNHKRCVEVEAASDDSGWKLELELEELIYVKAIAINTRNDNQSCKILNSKSISVLR